MRDIPYLSILQNFLDQPPYATITDLEWDALRWAIDQLRWRRVKDELPTACEDYLVVAGTSFAEPMVDTWDMQRQRWHMYHDDNITHWRPIDLPEGEE